MNIYGRRYRDAEAKNTERLAALEQIKTLVHNPLGNHNNPVWIIADEAVKEKKE